MGLIQHAGFCPGFVPDLVDCPLTSRVLESIQHAGPVLGIFFDGRVRDFKLSEVFDRPVVTIAQVTGGFPELSRRLSATSSQSSRQFSQRV